MQTSTVSPPQERIPEHPACERPPLCPVCAGRLVPLRDRYRCARCFYSLCNGCEGGEASPACD
jgi:hypothetical protein